jgi:hypothetical protein
VTGEVAWDSVGPSWPWISGSSPPAPTSKHRVKGRVVVGPVTALCAPGVQPVASRLLLEIGPQARERDEEGMNLVVSQISPQCLRQTEYILAFKGLRVARQIARMLS